ncbi:alpha/beta fold hydrolase [Actinomycetospora straminea]|uniref:3-oxoadipate enol-lactonase n=1 Tax=Actinomycetospora straminea TaxID=663607 RepID=A0ABP9E4E5_9PSEU|nr:alpha/beta fold hydrolase [Actinomycetospora straminea]MDD7932741.1 alpha/beta fold hydrolase [Actinomycetospora straminea]
MTDAAPGPTLVEVAPGHRTRVVDEGARDAAAVVLLHGTPLDLRAWDALIPALTATRRVVRVDARGHGTATPVPVADDARLAADVVAVLDLLDVRDAHVVGHSWGGQIAQRVAVEHPDRVRRLSLLCTRASPFPPFADLATSLRAGAVDLETLLGRWFTPEERAEVDGVAATVRAWLAAADHARWAEALDGIATFDGLADLATVTVPVDVVAAELDAVATPPHMAEIAAALPDATGHVLPGARHLVPLQRPAEIARILLAPAV